MDKCIDCENLQDPGSEYCWFHSLEFIEIGIIDRIKNYQKKKLILIPDLLLIVFEYVGYQEYLIFNFLEPVLTLDMLKQKIYTLDQQMYLQHLDSIRNSIPSPMEYTNFVKDKTKNMYNLILYEITATEDFKRWIISHIFRIKNEYLRIGYRINVLNCIKITDNYVLEYYDSQMDEYIEFDSGKIKVNELSGLWKLIYQILEIAKFYKTLRVVNV